MTSGDRARLALSAATAMRRPALSPSLGTVDSHAVPADEGGAFALDPSASTRSEAPPPIDLGLERGSWGKWGAFAAEPPEARPTARAPMPASSTGGLAEALGTYDRQTGLGPSGTVLSAARDAAAGADAPRSGTAQFAVTVYQNGIVEIALAAFSSSDAASWENVGKKVAASLRLKPPRLPSTRRGVRLVVELTIEERWPTGAPVRPEGPHILATPPALRSSEDAKAEIAKQSPGSAPPPGARAEQRPLAPIVDAPGAFVAGRGRLGQVAAGVGAFGETGLGDPGKKVATGLVVKGNADPTNLVGRAARTISTRVLGETIL